MKCSGAALPQGALGEKLFFASSGSGDRQHSLTCGHNTPISASTVTLPSLYASFLQGHLSLHLGPTWIAQGALLSQVPQLHCICKDCFLQTRSPSQVLGIRAFTYLYKGPPFSPLAVKYLLFSVCSLSQSC